MEKEMFAETRNRKINKKFYIRMPLLLLLLAMSFSLNAQNYAVSFDGNQDRITTPINRSNLTNFTMMTWFKFEGSSGDSYRTIIGSIDGSFFLGKHSGNNYFGIQDGNYISNFGTSTDAFDGNWHHLTYVKSGSTGTLYIDGIYVNSASFTGGASMLNIGMETNAYYWKGAVDEVRIYNYVFASEEEIVAEMYTELIGNELGLLMAFNLNESFGTTAYDLSPNENNGTLQYDAVFVSSSAPVLPNNSSAAPFSPVDPTGLPYSIIITGVTIDGGSLPTNASIAAYDGSTCVGSVFNNNNQNAQMVTWQADASQGLAGFTSGNPITFKVRTTWFSEMQIFTATPTFTMGNGNFGTGTFSVVSLNITTGLTPGYTISQSLFNFNALPINSSLSDTLIVTNTGTAILDVYNIVSSSTNFSRSPSSMMIDPGDSDTIVITFTPTQVVVYTETLTLHTDDPNQPTVSVALHGTGLPTPTPSISVMPQYLNYGNINIGDSLTLPFTVQNVGNGDLIITNVSTGLPYSTLTGPASLTLTQNQNQQYFLKFKPLAQGSYYTNLTVYSNNGNVNIAIYANAGQYYFNPASPTGLPYNIIVNSAEIDGNSIELGDQVGVFDNTLCVGVNNFSYSSGNSLTLDGSGDYLEATVNVSESNYTCEMWFKTNSSNGGLFSVIGGGHDRHIYLNNGNITTRVWSNEVINTSGYNYGDGNWHHVAHVFGGTQGGQKIYVDGILKASGSKSYSDFTSQTGIDVGYSADKGYFNGQIDEVRIWNYAKSQTEILAQMNNTLIGNEPNLEVYYSFDNFLPLDYSGNSHNGTLYGNANIQGGSQLVSNAFNIVTWEADPTQGLVGFTSGNPMSFKLYANVFDTWVELNATPTYLQGNGNFGYVPFTVVDLSATSGLDPELVFSDSSVYAGQVQVNQSTSDTFYIYNVGNAPANLSFAENSAAFSTSIQYGYINANDTVEVIVNFTPTTPGNYSTQLHVFSNDPEHLETIITLEGFALPVGQTDINLTQQNLEFNTVEVGNTKSLFFNVINNGTAPLTISGMSSSNGQFVASPTSFTLANTNDNQLVEVQFSPTGKGLKTGTLTVQSNAGNPVVNLSGVGIDGHFLSVNETGLPYTIVIEDHNLGSNLKIGDEIAVFDGSLCVGVSAVQSLSGSILLTAWQADVQLGLPGFTPGNAMSYKVWTSINTYDSEFDATATYTVGNGNFGYGMFSVCSLNIDVPDIIINPTSFFIALDEPDSTILNLNIQNAGTEDLYYELIPGENPNGTCLSLDGSNDYVALGSLSPGTQWTVEAWVKPSSTPSGRRTIFGGFASCVDWGISMSSGIYSVGIDPPSDCSQTVSGGIAGAAVIGEWAHVAATNDGTTARLYVNGVFLASAPVLTNYTGYGSDVRIGGEACCGGNNFPGLVDEVKLWNYVRSESDIASNMHNTFAGNEAGLVKYYNFDDGTANNLVGNGNNGTLQSGASISNIGAPTYYNWIQTQTGIDTLAQSTSVNVDINVFSAGLIDGLYNFYFNVKSNSLNNSNINLPITLNVTGNPQISIDPIAIDFGDLIVGQSSSQSIVLTNIGTDSLIIDTMYFDLNNAFSFTNPLVFPIEIAPLNTETISIDFTPTIDGLIIDSLWIISNASNEDTALVTLQGTGLTPADIEVSSLSWFGSMNSGDFMIDTFYIYNYGQANLEFTLINSIPWLSLNPAAGTVGVLDSMAIQINVSTVGVYAGLYSGTFQINSNDLIDPSLTYSMNLIVSGQPDLAAPNFHNFGVVNVGTYGLFNYIIQNIGSDTLFIDSLEISNPVFSYAGPGNFYILPGTSDTIPLLFAPSMAISYSGIFTVYSNAVNWPVFPVALQGVGNLPQNIVLNKDTVQFSSSDLLPGIQTFNIHNSGGQPLTYNLQVDNRAGKALLLDGNGDYLNVANAPELNPDTALTIEAWIYPENNSQEFIVAKEYSAVGNYRLYINSSGKLQFQLNNSKSVSSTTTIPVNTWTHVAASTNGKVLQVFINGVLDAEMTYAPFTISANTLNVRIGRSYFNEYFKGKIDELRIWGLYKNDTEIQAMMGQGLFGTEPGLALYYKFNEASGNIAQDASTQGNNGTFYGNATRTGSGQILDSFFSLSPTSGTISASGTNSINVNFTPNGFAAGDYEIPIRVNSNDPDLPQTTVLAMMTVSGADNLLVSPASLTFSDTYIGLSENLQIDVVNPGQALINVSDWILSDPDYSLEFEYPYVFPYSHKFVNVIFEPTSAGAHEDTLRIFNSSGNPILEVPLAATGLNPPIISLTQMSIGDTLYWGNTSTKQFRINNNGDGPLYFNFGGIPAQWLTVTPAIDTIPANSYLDVDFTFNGINDGGDYLAQLQLTSNDLVNPSLLVPVSLLLYGAEMSVSTTSLSKYVTYQELEHDTFFIVNNGFGPLNYTLTENANWLSLNQYSGSIPAGGHDSIFVTYDGNNPHGNYQTTINITSNDPNLLQYIIPVNLDILHATLVSLPSTLNFGYTVINVGETLNLQILNNGNVDLTIDSIYSVAPYTMPLFLNTFIPAGASIYVPVTFMPSYTVIYNETIHIATNIGVINVPVTGIGEMPSYVWGYSWSQHDFGLVDNAVGASKNLTIYNWGNVPFTMDDWSMSDTAHFSVSDTIFTIPVGGHKTVTVYFNPDAIAIYESTLLWTVNAIGTKEILLDGRGFFLSQAPILTYVDSMPYNGIHGVDPLIGSTDQWFEYRVIYTDADNNPPMTGYPVVGVGLNGDTDFLDSGEDEFPMYELDPTDVDYTDGKEYFFVRQLPINFNLGYSFFAYDSLGNPPVGEALQYRSDPDVSNDFLDVSIYANDINFSNLTPAVGEVVTISATVHNNSDYPAQNVSVKFYEEDSFLVELWIPYLGPQSSSTVYITHVFTIDEFYPMKVVIDEQNYIIEDNELNNFAIRPVVVGEFSIPGAIVVSANIAPSTVSPYGTVHYWGHADYVNSYDPNAVVSGAQVQVTIAQTGYTYTIYTNSVGDFSLYFTAPSTVGTYTVNATVTDFTLLANAPTKYFTVYVPVVNNPIMGPDLAITYWWGTDIHWTSECRRIGDPIEVTAIVTNIGNMTAYNALVHVFKDNSLILSPVYDSIPAGTNKIITFWVTYNTVDYHSVSVDIDPYDDIWELAEWNNYGQRTRWIYPLEPDLQPTNIWFSDNSPLQGHPINMTFRTANTQCTPTDTCSVDIYHIYGPDTFFLANVPVDAIGSLSWDNQYLYNQTFNQVGWHYIMMVVDPYNNVAELNEYNNTLTGSFYVEQAIADLKISDISFSAYNPPIGGYINFTATIWNNGTADASDFYVRYYIDGVQLSDSIWVNYLPAGVNMLITSDPWQVEDCPHQVSATVDEENLIPETNEYNNYTNRPIGTDFVPSLWPYYYSSHISVLVGSTVNMKCRVYNNGTLDADTVFVSYIMNGSTLIAYDGVPLINHQSYAPSNHLYTFNYTGDYDILIYADMIWPDSTRYCELDETNNTTILHIHVYGEDPDLQVLSQHISPTELNPDPGEVIDVYGSFTNEGNVPAGPFFIKFYANSVQLGDSIYVSGIAAHEDSTVACTAPFSSTLIGTHVLRMEVDAFNDVVETNEMNNMASRAIIVGDAPDHTFSDAGQGIWLSDTFPSMGDTILINSVIENNGGATGSAELVLSLEILNTTTVIATIPFTAAPYDSIDVPFNWVVTSPYGRIHANIVNSNPEEFNIYNNHTYIDFGTAIPPLTVSLDPSATLICKGQNVSIYSTVAGGLGTYFYTWMQNPYTGATSNPDVLVSPEVTTVYTLTVEDGFYTASASVTIQVIDVDVNLGPDLQLCGDTSYVLDAGTFDTYLWSTGETTQTITITDNGTYWVSVEMLNFGCTDSDTIYVNMNQGLSPMNDVITSCGQYYFVYHSPRSPYLYFEWSTGSTADTAIFTQPGFYYLTVTDEVGCTTVDTIEFIVELVSVDLGPDQTICSGQTLTLDAGQQSNYFWSTGASTQTISVTQTGYYSVTVSNSNECADHDTIFIQFVSGLYPNLGQLISICPGGSIVLDPGNYANYLWNDQSTNATLTVNSVGTYSVTVSDQTGCSGSTSVEVAEISVPALNLPDLTWCGNPIPAGTNQGISWLWSTGATNDSITITDMGTYSLTVTFQSGCSRADTFDVNDGQLYFDLGNDTAICSGESFDISVPVLYVPYEWSTGDTSSTITISDGGIYYLTITNPDSQCETVDSIIVTMNPLPEIIWDDQVNLCSGQFITLDPGVFASYFWNNQSTNQILLVSSPGTYMVTVTDQNGCENFRSAWVTQVASPTIDLGPDTTVCEGETVTLDPGVFSGYMWNDQSTNQTLTVGAQGTYYVSVNDANGCGAFDQFVLTVIPISVDLGPDVIMCPGGSVTLDATQFETYLWSNQATTQSITVNQTGVYSITVSDSNGCTAWDDVAVLPSQIAQFDLGPDLNLCQGDQATLFAGYYDTYNWSNGSTNQTLTVWLQNMYSVTVSDLNGCSVSDSINVYVHPLPVVSIIGLDTSYCDIGDVIPLTGSPQGGNFTGTGVSMGSFNPSLVNPGSITIYYSYTDNNGCTNSTSASTTVYAAPTVSFTGLEAQYFTDDPADTLTGSPAGGFFSGGNMQTNIFDPMIAGVGTHTISYGYTDAYGCSDVASQSVFVTTVYDISGAVLYNNQAQTPINPAIVYLEDNNHNALEFTPNNTSGDFQFTQYPNGTYYLSATANLPVNGINATDALNIRRHVVMLTYLGGLNLAAADVNASGGITAADALLVLRKTVGYITSFPAGTWVFDNPQVIILNSDTSQNVYGVCFGDVNDSYQSNPTKQASFVAMEKSGIVQPAQGEEFILPIAVKSATQLGAVTMVINYPSTDFEIISVESKLQDLLYKAENGTLRLAWENVDGAYLSTGEAFVSLKMIRKSDKQGGNFMLTWETEFADINGNVLKDIIITMPEIGSQDEAEGFALGHNFPNPFSNLTHIDYSIPDDAQVRLVVQDVLGQELEILVDDNQDAGNYIVEFNGSKLSAGIYIYKIEVAGESGKFNASRIMQIIK
ncbi:MAG: choice-of-anchor D domain-containing protein [Bacteroidales bacterium]|nr:choice-of-anchor D domain-containing protein [Bacteroidales bacterium]MCF8454944.1 choice-of-anchor D domain-containing protein [Bacteroidales bacterium]